jgi:hypothetical protein
MRTYEELSELAKICASNSRTTTSRDVAAELWRMARRYQKQAAEFHSGKLPDIGEPPHWLSENFEVMGRKVGSP